jgi:hypothetical protein
MNSIYSIITYDPCTTKMLEPGDPALTGEVNDDE